MDTHESAADLKIHHMIKDKTKSRWQQYCDLVIGNRNFWFFFKYEFITFFFSNFPGALGFLLRKWTYPWILGKVGKGVLFGHHITFRHPQKITIEDGAVIDDYCMLDAKGHHNQGMKIGKNVFIGRQSILYVKDGDIVLEDDVNIGHRCIIFSSNQLKIGEGTLLAAECCVMSGGAYDYRSEVRFSEQEGMISKGSLTIGTNCWLGAKVVVLDGASIGDGSVIGAGSVVTKPVPSRSVAVGVPAKVVKSIDR